MKKNKKSIALENINTNSDFKNQVEFKKRLQFVLIAFCVFAFLFYIFMVFIYPRFTYYNYVDECGIMPGGNGLTHTIANEDNCNNACYSYCQSKKKALFKFEFKEEKNKCNTCKCQCY